MRASERHASLPLGHVANEYKQVNNLKPLIGNSSSGDTVPDTTVTPPEPNHINSLSTFIPSKHNTDLSSRSKWWCVAVFYLAN
ncbi:hypothetical protein EVAR_38647_1 [Eumeta japonica]|uniref:Uncharacterized protein n=1 Tax=Eumeta variegata TaxID=151549 RepID=A0A4C1XWT0_EUMVA|nr:hypothetical protein EVAR_38647_1 [Eumeta japonica]